MLACFPLRLQIFSSGEHADILDVSQKYFFVTSFYFLPNSNSYCHALPLQGLLFPMFWGNPYAGIGSSTTQLSVPWLLDLEPGQLQAQDGSVCGYGIRVSSSSQGSDSWVDDPITRHIISLQVDNGEEGVPPFLLWPLVLHIKGQYRILVFPLVEPRHLVAYEKLCRRTDCGNPAEVKENGFIGETLSSILLDLPCITGYGKFLLTFS
eukprot:Gb_05097 [translate_table: standard]